MSHDMVILVKTFDHHDDGDDSELDKERKEELLQLARWTMT